MHVLVVTFQLGGLDDATHRQQAAARAPQFVAVPGLLAKTWLADAAANRYGGVSHFADQSALDAYLATPTVDGLRRRLHFADLLIQVYGTIAAATRITGGALPEAAAGFFEGRAREQAA